MGLIPAVLITFDDGNANNYTLAYPTLASRNINATIYMISSWINGGGGNYLTTAQLQALDTAGWDIGNHTQTHPHLDELSEAEQETELTNCKNALDAFGLTRASSHVAYPFGAYNADTLTAMAATGMLTGRIYNGTNLDGVLMSSATWDELVSIEIKYTTTLDTAKGLLNRAMCAGKVAALVFHNIVESDATTNQWLNSDLAALADWINQKNLVSLTISQLHALRSGSLEYSNPWYSA